MLSVAFGKVEASCPTFRALLAALYQPPPWGGELRSNEVGQSAGHRTRRAPGLSPGCGLLQTPVIARESEPSATSPPAGGGEERSDGWGGHGVVSRKTPVESRPRRSLPQGRVGAYTEST